MKTPRFWQTRNFSYAALLPASFIYRFGTWLHRRLATPKRAGIPVIAIGNVTAGGAGKTPTVLALVPILRALGYSPHILTRGYGGAHLTAHRVAATDSWMDVGDEALLLAAAAPTWVGRDRFASAQTAARAGATVLVCDDALQHYGIHADINLLIIDGPYGIGNGALLPAGPLREALSTAVKRCDGALIIGPDTQQLARRITIPTLQAHLTPQMEATALADQRWVAFAGIARPEKFYETLRALGATLVATRDYADHYAYHERDIAALLAQAETMGARLITTAKDAVKLPPAFLRHITVLPIALNFDSPAQVNGFLAQKLARLQGS